MPEEQLHRAQMHILYMLRRSASARYSDLRKPTGLESDVFKFHLQKLVKRKLVIKNAEGLYELTAAGKELANNLDRSRRNVQKQPKLSVLLIIRRETVEGEEYLLQRRQRNPFYGFWSCLTGPIRWSETAESAAARELQKQTGLSGSFSVRSFYRKRDYLHDSDELLEDKLFIIVEVTDLQGEAGNAWSGGHNAWVKREDVVSLAGFDNLDILNTVDARQPYREVEAYYRAVEY